MLQFGFGCYACPSRFFTANEIKIVVANFIIDYNIKLPKGVEERYLNIAFSVILS